MVSDVIITTLSNARNRKISEAFAAGRAKHFVAHGKSSIDIATGNSEQLSTKLYIGVP